MSSPVRPLATRQEHRGELSEWEASTRIAVVIYLFTNPLMALVSFLTGVVLVRQRRLRPHIYLTASTVALLAVLLTTQLPRYMRFGIEGGTILARATREHGAEGPGGVWRVASPELAAGLQHWLVLQIPFALGAGLFIGALWAAWRRRRVPEWRQEDPATVAVPAKALTRAMRKTPLWPESPKPQPGLPVASVKDLRIRIGNEFTGEPRPYDLTVGELGYQAFLDGPSGFGKTTTLLEIVAGLVEAPAAAQFSNPLVFVNMKPDPEITATLAAIADAGGRAFHHVTTSEGSYDPFGGKAWSEIASQVIETEANSQDGGFSEPHHRRAAERFLRFSARAMVQLAEKEPKKWHRDYLTLASLLQVETMTANSAKFDRDLAKEWGQYALELGNNKRLVESVDGLRQRVAAAAEGGARDVLRASPDALRLESAIDAGALVLFDLDAAADATSARLIGNLALQDIMSSMARLNRRSWQYAQQAGQLVRDRKHDPIQVRHFQLIVDEFGALGGTILANSFQRLRSLGGGVLLSTQEMGSLDLAGPTFAETVLTNSNVLMLHHQGPRKSEYAEHLGTKAQMIETHQLFEEGSLIAPNVYASGQGNIREGQGFRVHPNELQQLTPGQMIVRVNSRVGNESGPIARVQVRRLAQQRHRGHEEQEVAAAPAEADLPSKESRSQVPAVPRASEAQTPSTSSQRVPRPLPSPRQTTARKARPVPVEGKSVRSLPRPASSVPDESSVNVSEVPRSAVDGRTDPPLANNAESAEETEVIPWGDYDD